MRPTADRSISDGPKLGRITYQQSGRWWTASMASFPGAYSQGKTQEEAYRNLLVAIRDLVEAYVELARPPRRRRVKAA